MDRVEDLEDIRSQVLHMGGVVEDQLSRSITALAACDPDVAREVMQNDSLVDALEVEIDDACTRILADHRLTREELRSVMAVIRAINDLERIGDEVRRVAKMVDEGQAGVIAEDVRQEIEHMGCMVGDMLRNVLDAFARIDADGAVAVARADRKVDLKYRSITRQLMTYMAQDHSAIPQVLNLLWAARALERVGDRCQNIAEYVIYMVLGKDVRHVSLKKVMAELERA